MELIVLEQLAKDLDTARRATLDVCNTLFGEMVDPQNPDRARQAEQRAQSALLALDKIWQEYRDDFKTVGH